MAANNLFSSFLDSSVPNSGGPPRLSPSALGQQQPTAGVNGNGAALSSLPVSAGQQTDVNFLFHKVLELSEILRENRERTQGIVAGAEELATRAAANGAIPSLQEANEELATARIADLQRRLAVEQHKVQVLVQEQKENTALIGEWEHEVGKLVEKVRDHTFNNLVELQAQARHYNKLLQEERDAHLQARVERDEWHSKFMRSVAMMREAYKLRCDEEEVPYKVVSGLQNEVRALRSALGMEPEKPEDEFGWEILKDEPENTNLS